MSRTFVVMITTVLTIVTLAVTIIAIAPVVVAQTAPQPAPPPQAPLPARDLRSEILGVWEGEVRRAAAAGSARLEFLEEGGLIKWKWEVTGPVRTEAVGTIAKVDSASFSFAGPYTFHTSPGYLGTQLNFVVTVSSNQMTGTVTSTRGGVPFNLTLQKKST